MINIYIYDTEKIYISYILYTVYMYIIHCMYNRNVFFIHIYIYHTEWQELKNKSKCTPFSSSKRFYFMEKVIPKMHDIFTVKKGCLLCDYFFFISPNWKKVVNSPERLLTHSPCLVAPLFWWALIPIMAQHQS